MEKYEFEAPSLSAPAWIVIMDLGEGTARCPTCQQVTERGDLSFRAAKGRIAEILFSARRKRKKVHSIVVACRTREGPRISFEMAPEEVFYSRGEAEKHAKARNKEATNGERSC